MLENKINPSDYVARFSDSICRYKGMPARVLVHSSRSFELIFLCGKRKNEVINPLDKDFDISSIPMGYVNHRGKVLSCVRTSRRRYTQGVTSRNIAVYGIDGAPTQRGEETFSVYSPEVHQMVIGDFPKFESALKILQEGSVESLAVSRRVALQYVRTGIVNVYVSHKLLGWIPPKKNYVNVEDSKISSMLVEELEALEIPVKGRSYDSV